MRGASDILSLAEREVIVCDGAMGTMLQTMGLPAGTCPESWNLSPPHAVEEIHRRYVEAGARVVTTNTLGANRIKLAEFGLGDRTEEINRAAVQTALRAAGKNAVVAASVGPTGLFLEPFGPLTFDDAYQAFLQQCEALSRAGAHLIIVETMVDLQEIRAAILAAKDSTDLPIAAQMSFDQGERSVVGTDATTAAVALDGLDVAVIGSNCGTGPKGMESSIRAMACATPRLLIAQPNAGLPTVVESRTVFTMTPEEMAQASLRLAEAGANLIGSCCGSTPEHTRAIARSLQGMRPLARDETTCCRIASRTRTVEIGRSRPFLLVGERINPSGRRELSRELRVGKMSMVRRDAAEQVKRGAGAIDVNVAVPDGDEFSAMELAITAVQEVSDAPLFVDSLDMNVIERALRLCPGRPVINSVSGEKARTDPLLSLAKRYGASLVVLPLDGKGVPRTVGERMAIARRVVDRANELGIGRDRIIVDGIVLTAATSQELVKVTLGTVERAGSELGVATILGVSNISHGLPRRSPLNAALLTMAMDHGLDAAIANPYDSSICESIDATSVLVGRDPGCRRYASSPVEVVEAEEPVQEDPTAKLAQEIALGSKESVPESIQEILSTGREPLSIMNEILIPAIREVGERFEQGSCFLPQLIASAEAVEVGLSVLKPLLGQSKETKGRVLMATVRGDIHDIGKNLVGTVLRSHGYQVIDLGKDVPTETIVDRARSDNIDVVGLSALMTTTMGRMGEVVEELQRDDCTIPVLVGGAVVNEAFARRIGAFYGHDALDAVRQVEGIIASSNDSREHDEP
jgi:5-methyltetrahydrofolate--homocysteine methyltransferase